MCMFQEVPMLVPRNTTGMPVQFRYTHERFPTHAHTGTGQQESPNSHITVAKGAINNLAMTTGASINTSNTSENSIELQRTFERYLTLVHVLMYMNASPLIKVAFTTSATLIAILVSGGAGMQHMNSPEPALRLFGLSA